MGYVRMRNEIHLGSSLERPAWLQYDLDAFNHKFAYGKIKIDYYKKRRQNGKEKVRAY